MLKIAVFSYDAGGSELIASLEKEKESRYSFFNFSQKDAPFLKIVDGDVFVESSKNNIIKQLFKIKPDIILTTTSWQTNGIDLFLEFAKEHNIKSVSFVDHWTPYRTRFREVLPDFLATFDKKSTFKAMQEGFSNVIQIKNYHIYHLYKQYKKLQKNTFNRVLFLSEPTSYVALKRFGDKKYWGFDETGIFKEVKSFAKKLGMDLLVRLHPSDNKERYLQIDKNIKFSSNTLLDDIASAEIIVGIDTIAMHYAFLFGKKVIALMPTDKREVVVDLPKENIKKSLENIDINSIKTTNQDIFYDNGIDFDEFVSRYIL